MSSDNTIDPLSAPSKPLDQHDQPQTIKNLMANDRYTLELDGVEFTLRHISGFRYMKIYSAQTSRETSDLYRDLILATLLNPILSKEEIEDLQYTVFIKLAQEIIKYQERVGKN
ncbi:hypothetical protein [Bacteroides sp.]|uniref:hypothetical protein n=1 Tax=Bacteroides sp. TaxID=29523 RepID=UPI0026126DF8|nr:hypothetical protein [Bacteroides sp.]MDD3039011.1 hypothetical protein [Bacteroides sp.]